MKTKKWQNNGNDKNKRHKMKTRDNDKMRRIKRRRRIFRGCGEATPTSGPALVLVAVPVHMWSGLLSWPVNSRSDASCADVESVSTFSLRTRISEPCPLFCRFVQSWRWSWVSTRFTTEPVWTMFHPIRKLSVRGRDGNRKHWSLFMQFSGIYIQISLRTLFYSNNKTFL